MSYILLFIWCFLASSIVPLSSEPYFVALIKLKHVWILPLIVASIANTFGSVTTFWIGQKTEELTIHKLSQKNQKRVEKAQKMLHRYGAITLLLSWVPFLGDVLVGIAGALHFPFWKSTFWITIGKTLRYALLAAITLQFI